ncbi:MAG: alpha-galactosidase [Clostridia bacterium]|nr:alpha-galactosidase [Clostridia bacterium]
MKNPRFFCEYKYNGNDFLLAGTSSAHLDAEFSVTDDAVKLTLKPQAAVTLTKAWFEFDHDFKDDDKFFSNGYQSWTTSREYTKDDIHYGINKLAKMYPFIKLSGTSSDVWFCEDKELKGVFRSHCYTYIKNGENFLFLGSLSEKQGYTIFHVDMNNSKFSIAKDVEGLTIDTDYPLYDVVILSGDENYVFDKYFELMGVKKPKIDHLAGYTSWYNYFQKIDQNIIYRDLDAMDPIKEHANIFQIDDGYETFVGDWLDPNPAKFPDGMKAVADRIHDKGYMAGIWIAPFSVQIKSRTFREHPDWVIRDEKGKPILGCVGWGGAYTLDIYNPEVREYIRHFFDVILNDWGYDMVKLDFLYSECMFPRNNKTRGTIMCEAMEFLRECCGDKLILGCGVPLGAAFGQVDACRISCDVDLSYKPKIYNTLHVNNEIMSAQNAMNNSIFRRQLNGRVFTNDPDVFFLRYSNLKFTMEQKILLGFVNHICGDVLFVSDNMEEYVDADFDAVKKFYEKSEFRILDANYTKNNKKVIIKLLDKNGDVRILWYDTATGFGNYEQISGIFAKR